MDMRAVAEKWQSGLGAGIFAGRACFRAFATVSTVVALLCVFAAPAVAASGSLTVRISGLPLVKAPSGLLAEPGGLRRPVPARGLRIARARPGVYRLTLRTVRIARTAGAVKKGAVATPLRRTITVRVLAGRRASLLGSYATIINPGVKTLSDSAVVSIRGPAGDPSKIVLRGHRVFARDAILSLPPSTLLPRGVLSPVRRVSNTAGNTTVSLRAASPYEVAPSLQFDMPARVSQASAASLSAGCGAPSGVSPYRRIKDISFSGGWNTVHVLGVGVPIGVRATVHFTAEAGVTVTGGLGVSCSLKASISANGMAGPIPVTAGIQGELTAFAGIGGILDTSGSLHVDAGASTIGTPPVLLWVPSVAFSNPQFKLTAKKFAQAGGSIGIAVKLGVGNDNVASATLNLGTSLDLSAQPGSCTWNARFGQFSTEGKLLGWDIETPKTPALYTKKLWHSPCGQSGG